MFCVHKSMTEAMNTPTRLFAALVQSYKTTKRNGRRSEAVYIKMFAMTP